MIPSEIKTLTTTHALHIIDIPSIEPQLKDQLDKFLVSICEGKSDSELIDVKLRLKKFLTDKTHDTQMGAIAEIFVHLYLRTNKYKQEFLFFNLEESSVKKGFDGLFSKENDTYLLESKSGSITSKDMSHKLKLKEAYSDLSQYVSGTSKKGKNNPWRNAYNHASHMDVGANKSIRAKINELQKQFDQGTFHDISNFKIIPCSTIYLSDRWTPEPSAEIKENNDFIPKFKGSEILAICITKASLDMFFDYLGDCNGD